MAKQVTNYQCPACGGPLHFDSRTERLQCDHCDSTFSPEEVELHYAEKDRAAADEFEPMDEEEAAASLSPEEKNQCTHSRWDGSTISAEWGELTDKVRTYNCPSCGAQLLCELTTAATSCPYCGNPSIVPGQLNGELKPDYVIPFKLDREAAVQALKNHYKKKRFLPKQFTQNNQIQKLQGIYVPFWLYNAKASAQCYFKASNSFSHRQGDYIVTETAHYDVRRFGTVTFAKVPADASKKMPNDLMDALEPYDYTQLKPFSASYLPGYLADKYDVGATESAQRVDRRCTASTLSAMRADVAGYQTVVPVHSESYIDRGKVEYALLPVWIIKTSWNGKDYLFAMNGQTGKFVGNLPISAGKFWGWMLGLTAGLTAVFTLIGAGEAIVQMLRTLFA